MRRIDSFSGKLEVLNLDGKCHSVPPLPLSRLIAIQELIENGTDKDVNLLEGEIIAVLQPVLPDEVMETVGKYRLEQVIGLTVFLTGVSHELACRGDSSPADLRFAAALVMKQFGAYRLDDLLEMALPEFLVLYRLACAVQADEALMVQGQGVAAALSNNLRPLAERRRALASSPRRLTVTPLSAEEIAEARQFAAELLQNHASKPAEKLCSMADFSMTSPINQTSKT